MARPFRVAVQLIGEQALDAPRWSRLLEERGFDLVLLADHIGDNFQSPMLSLAAVAASTERIRLGTYVLNNDMRNPVQLAWESSTLDRLSGGRLELRLGARHTPHEYAATGIARDAGPKRKDRLFESLGIIRRLLDGETVDFSGEFYEIEGAHISASEQDRLPILVAASGARFLRATGSLADGVGLTGMRATLSDGHLHSVDWSSERLDNQVAHLAEGAESHDRSLEISALVQHTQITNGRDAALAKIAATSPGLTMDDARSCPYLLVGTVDEVATHMQRCYEAWGITTFAIRLPNEDALDAFAPVLAALG